MRLLAVMVGVCLAYPGGAPPLRRTIDRCAQDGVEFLTPYDDSSTPVQIEHDGIAIRIEGPTKDNPASVLTFSKGKRALVKPWKDFDAVHGWLTVGKSGFATTWMENASTATTQLYRVKLDGEIVEDAELIPRVERMFVADAKQVCTTPGSNTTAIKWADDDHILLSVNAWASGVCLSNFTEGFLVSMSKQRVEKKLSEAELLNLPAVCTWNLVPVDRH